MEKKSFLVREVEFNEMAKAVAAEVVAMLKDSAVLSSIASAREDDLIDSKEACRILGCGERTLQRYRSAQLLNVIYRGPHRCYYVRAEVLAFRAANTKPSRDSK